MEMVETRESPGFIATGRFWMSDGVEEVADAAVVGDFSAAGGLSMKPLRRRWFSGGACPWLSSWSAGISAAVERLGVDGFDGDRADDVVVAVDELADVGGLVEGPGDAVLGDGVFEGQVGELGRGRGRGPGCRR